MVKKSSAALVLNEKKLMKQLTLRLHRCFQHLDSFAHKQSSICNSKDISLAKNDVSDSTKWQMWDRLRSQVEMQV